MRIRHYCCLGSNVTHAYLLHVHSPQAFVHRIADILAYYGPLLPGVQDVGKGLPETYRRWPQARVVLLGGTLRVHDVAALFQGR